LISLNYFSPRCSIHPTDVSGEWCVCVCLCLVCVCVVCVCSVCTCVVCECA
jgi:hypothetical protein